MLKKKCPIILIILDGFGYSKLKKNNPIYEAHKPNLDYFVEHFPNTLLNASGKYVGLLPGFIGNSEVGHLTIGAGKIVKQPLTILHESIDNGNFYSNKKLVSNLKKLNENKNALHIIGILSDSGVHAHEKHLYAFLKAAIKQKIKKIYLHIILDGRDVESKSAKKFLQKLDRFINKYDFIKIGSIHGRYFAMDRDNNWDRIKKSYEVLTEKKDVKFKNWKDLIEVNYKQGITDEFIEPTQLDQSSIIKSGDGIIFFNYRPERARQLTSCFVNPKIKNIKLKNINLTFFITPFSYAEHLKTVALFNRQKVNNTLMEVLSKKGYKTLAIAETEKYAHVTYFISASHEKPFFNETQILIPSIKSKNYIKHPCMSADKITDYVVDSLKKNVFDFYLINYANADMVGHSGDFNATKKAIECLDKQLGRIYQQAVENDNGTIYITADHGNAEIKFDQKSKQPSKAHTRNKVPFIMINKKLKDKKIKLPLNGLSGIKNLIIKN